MKFMSEKSEVIKQYDSFRAFVITQQQKKIKYLQSDNRREYVNKQFNALLKEYGIGRCLTAPYNPERNGVAERRNRTLLKAATFLLLIQSGLPPSKFTWPRFS